MLCINNGIKADEEPRYYIRELSMLKRALFGLCLLSASAFTPLFADETTSFCANEWPNDADMRGYCVDEQRSAAHQFGQKSGSIRDACADEWLPDYEMALYCYNEQSAARNRLASDSTDEVTGHCQSEWGSDHEMVEYCINEQRSARDRLSDYPDSLVSSCREEWGQDYEMVEYCAQGN